MALNKLTELVKVLTGPDRSDKIIGFSQDGSSDKFNLDEFPFNENDQTNLGDFYSDWNRKNTVEELNATSTLNLDFEGGEYKLDDGERTNTTNASDILSVTRATPKWVRGPNGYYREVPPNVVAREWKADGSVGALIEGSATNELLYSTQFDNAVWAKTRATVTANAVTAPDGTVTADKLVESTDDATHFVVQSINVSESTSYALSIFLKAGERQYARLTTAGSDWGTTGTIDVDLTNGDFLAPEGNNHSVTDVGNGWYRVSVSGVTGATDVNRGLLVLPCISLGGTSYQGDGTSGLYLWQAQLETGTRPTSPIITTDAPVTRAADNVKRVLGSEWDQSNFTLLVDFYPGLVSDTLHRYFTLYASSVDRITVGWGSEFNNELFVYYGVDGNFERPDVSLPDGQAVEPSQRIRLAISKSGPVVTVVANGGTPVSATADSDWSVDITELRIGQESPSTIGGGKFADSVIYPYAITDTQLQEITS